MKLRRTRLERAWLVIAIVLIGAVAIVVVGFLMASDRQGDIWVEIVSRASQLIVLALAGGVVGAVIHDRDAAREDVRRRQAFLLAFVGEVEAAFTQVKTSRRQLRTHGFDAPRDSRLTREQVEGFRTQMALLNDAELQFETLARRVNAVPAQFGSVAPTVVAELTAIHTYLNEVLRDWQAGSGHHRRWCVRRDHGRLAALPCLRGLRLGARGVVPRRDRGSGHGHRAARPCHG